jgi:hypothetical protein
VGLSGRRLNVGSFGWPLGSLVIWEGCARRGGWFRVVFGLIFGVTG